MLKTKFQLVLFLEPVRTDETVVLVLLYFQGFFASVFISYVCSATTQAGGRLLSTSQEKTFIPKLLLALAVKLMAKFSVSKLHWF